MEYVCPYCKSMNGTKINTYKHYWITCNECGTVIRERKNHYTYDRPIFRFIIQKTPLRRLYGKTLLPIKEVIEDEKHFYDYYNDTAKKGVAGTKWEKVNQNVFVNLERYRIDVKGKSILDISGGPGFLTKDLTPLAKRVVVTEFSQYAVDGMKKALEIEAVKFDYNTDQINECIDGKFDIIFIIYSIGFCNDLRNFVQSLKKIMHEGSLVYISYSPPTLGLMTRWQFDEYTYTRCWPIETMEKSFAEIGMVEMARIDEGSYRFDRNWFKHANPIVSLFYGVHRVIGKYYLRRILRKDIKINKELVQKNILQIYKFRNK
jgi:SAM-dependent methyltransferase